MTRCHSTQRASLRPPPTPCPPSAQPADPKPVPGLPFSFFSLAIITRSKFFRLPVTLPAFALLRPPQGPPPLLTSEIKSRGRWLTPEGRLAGLWGCLIPGSCLTLGCLLTFVTLLQTLLKPPDHRPIFLLFFPPPRQLDGVRGDTCWAARTKVPYDVQDSFPDTEEPNRFLRDTAWRRRPMDGAPCVTQLHPWQMQIRLVVP